MKLRHIKAAAIVSCAAATASLMYSEPAQAVFATEGTQILNHIQLGMSYLESVKSYEELLAGQVTRMAQYETMLMHLVQFPQSTMNTFSEAWDGQVQFFTRLSSAVSNVADVNSKMKTLFNGKYGGDDASWLAQYHNYRSQLDSDHSNQYLSDLHGLSELSDMSSRLDALKTQSGQISGSTEGLQLIARTGAIQAKQNSEIQSLLQRQVARQEQDDMMNAQSDESISQMAMNQIEAANAARSTGESSMTSGSVTVIKPPTLGVAP